MSGSAVYSLREVECRSGVPQRLYHVLYYVVENGNGNGFVLNLIGKITGIKFVTSLPNEEHF